MFKGDATGTRRDHCAHGTEWCVYPDSGAVRLALCGSRVLCWRCHRKLRFRVYVRVHLLSTPANSFGSLALIDHAAALPDANRVAVAYCKGMVPMASARR